MKDNIDFFSLSQTRDQSLKENSLPDVNSISKFTCYPPHSHASILTHHKYLSISLNLVICRHAANFSPLIFVELSRIEHEQHCPPFLFTQWHSRKRK